MLHTRSQSAAPRSAALVNVLPQLVGLTSERRRPSAPSARQQTRSLQPRISAPLTSLAEHVGRQRADVRCTARLLMRETPATVAAASTDMVVFSTTTQTVPAPAQPKDLKEQAAVQPKFATVCELTPDSFAAFLDCEDVCVVDFYTDWCGPCRIMDKEMETLTRCFPTFKFARVNCSPAEHHAFSTAQRIRSLPTIRIYKNKVQLEQVTGARPVQLRQSLSHYFALYSRRT